MHVIPAIDLLNGKVVRLEKGDYDQCTVYNDDPVSEAKKFKDAGFNHIHVVDLNGAKEGAFVNLDHIRRMISELDLSVQTGGGIRSYENAEMLLSEGISQVICSSMAVKKPEEWLEIVRRHPEKATLGMDLKEGKVAYSGWLETVDSSIAKFLEPMLEAGLKTVLCTDISRDGMLSGPNLELYQELQSDFPGLNFIASGGVSNADDLKKLEELNLYGVVVGRAYYEQKLSLEEMSLYNYSH